MNKYEISCSYKQSKLNPKLYVCEHCKSVVKQSQTESENICPALLDKFALDPDIKSIRLKETKIETKNGRTLKEIPHDSNDPINVWWNLWSSKKKNKTMDQKQKRPLIQSKDKKQCTQEQIDQRMNICQSCPFYENNTCLKCGCSLTRERNYMNKLLWADQSCPDGRWGPIS